MAGLKKILLIEDDFMIRGLYQTAFTKAGYQIELTTTADETYEKIKTFKPDVIFIDIMLPGKSGLEILKELKGNEAYDLKNAKMILLTNLGQEDLAETARKYKADGYIVKADTVPSDLINIVRSL